MKRLGSALELLGPVAIVAVVGIAGSFTSRSNEIQFRNTLVAVAIVVALYVFVGNSGVLSFGHVSFVAVGAFASGIMTLPSDVKPGVLPDMFPLLRDHSMGNAEGLALAAALGGAYAFLVGMPLMRLSGLAAGIATFAVLGITHNVIRNWTKIGPGAGTLSLVPETTDLLQATLGAIALIGIAYAFQRSRLGRMLRATREDPAAAQAAGINVHRQRLWAFTLSGALSAFAGALLVHLLGNITTEQVYLELTFLSLAMLVIGGMGSLWGAVLGALLISGFSSFLTNAEDGVDFPFHLDLPTGTRLVVVGAFMALVLIVRPSGVTGGKELSLPVARVRSWTRYIRNE
jgi:branched-chain amino acid transport system permease protein